MRKLMYTIKLETLDNEKYLQAEKLVKQLAKSEGVGETSNLDLCYFLDDEKKARVKFDNYYIPMHIRTIELTNAVDTNTLNRLIGLFA